MIVALGGNGPITSVESAAPLIEAAGERPVFFVTVRAPHPFQDENNALMYKLAEKYPQVGILDWYKFSEGHDDYFYDEMCIRDSKHTASARLTRRTPQLG